MTDRPQDHARAEAAFAEFRRTGSPRAMAEVFDRTATGLLLFARRCTRDASSAEDLLQQTFLRAIERAHTFTPGSPLMPWLTTILANEARMELRRRRTPDPDRLVQAASDEPSHAAERREAAAAMHAALAELPPAYRDVVALRFLHGTRPGRIAMALDVPLPTVKTRLHRGMRKLAASLPRGIALGTAVAISAGRGLPACRRAVTRAADVSTAATWTLTGVLVMKKTILPIAAALLLLAALCLLIPGLVPGKEPAAPGPAISAVAPAAGTPRTDAEANHREPAADTMRTPAATAVPERNDLLAAIEVRAHWRSSGQSAAGIPITLIVQPADWLARETTNESGRATFDLQRYPDLATRATAGVSVSCDLQPGRYQNVRLDQGEKSPHVFEFELEDARQVAGIVVDSSGAPVAGAGVWLTVDSHQPAMLLARTDAAGHFVLRGLSPGFSLRATHDSAASAPVGVAQLQGDGEIVLRLTDAAARLDVLVTDPAGQPLAHTAVHLDDRNRSANRRWFATTGDDGRAGLAGIAPGRYQLEVVHPSFPPAQVEIAIASANEERSETVRLGISADVEGLVRLTNGNPVAWAMVTLGHDASSLLQRSSFTDREGRFRLAGVAVGRHCVWITRAVPDFRRYIDLHAGPQTIELVVPGGNRIAGRLVDPEGRALAGWHVQAVSTSGFQGVTTTTAGDGRFLFEGVTADPWLLHVGEHHYPVTTFTDVATDGRESVYRLPADAVPKAFIVGQLANAPGCSLVLSRRGALDERGSEYLAVPDDGRFELGPFPPVAHDVGFVRPGSNRIWWLTTADLAANARCDLGTIRVPEPGTLEVTVRDNMGCTKLSVGVRAVVVGGYQCEGLEQIDREHWRATDLAPGEYDVSLHDEQTAPVMQRIAVASSRTSRITLMTAPGAVLAWRLAPPAGVAKRAIGLQGITIRDASGNVVVQDRIMGALAHRRRLLEGDYSIQVATGGGFRGSTQFVVPQADNAEVVVPLVR